MAVHETLRKLTTFELAELLAALRRPGDVVQAIRIEQAEREDLERQAAERVP